MKKLLNKFYQVIDKVGKPNFILIVFVLIIIIVSGLYQTFSLYTTTEQASFLEGLKTYKFILNTDTTYSVTIAADSVKNVAITIKNPEKMNLKYGICYDTTTGVKNNLYISSLETSEHPAQGIITKGSSHVVSIKIENRSSSDVTVNFRVAYGLENGGELDKEAGELWIDQTSNSYLLNTVNPGDYVDYKGNNGCSGNACSGATVTCGGFTSSKSGWRVAYIKNNSAYLISAGVPECAQTYVDSRNSSTFTETLGDYEYYYGSGYTFNDTTGKFTLTGETSNTLSWNGNYSSIISSTPYTCKSRTSSGTCDTLYEVVRYSSATQGSVYPHYNYELPDDSTHETPIHFEHLNNVALKYCNTSYAYDGSCTSSSIWSMRASDFQNITGRELSATSCYYQFNNTECGYGNDLIANGGRYWISYAASGLTSSVGNVFYWESSTYNFVGNTYSRYSHGVRPVIRLASSVVVTGGSGTPADPYRIDNT